MLQFPINFDESKIYAPRSMDNMQNKSIPMLLLLLCVMTLWLFAMASVLMNVNYENDDDYLLFAFD